MHKRFSMPKHNGPPYRPINKPNRLKYDKPPYNKECLSDNGRMYKPHGKWSNKRPLTQASRPSIKC